MPGKSLHYHAVWLAIGATLLGLTVWFSLAQIPPGWTYQLGEGPLHALTYAVITCWFGLIYPGPLRQLLIACLFVILGIALELLQVEITTVRRFDMNDMIANGLGAAIGWAALRTPLGGVLHKLDARMAGR